MYHGNWRVGSALDGVKQARIRPKKLERRGSTWPRKTGCE